MATNYYEDGYVAMTFDGKIIYYNKGNINIYNIVINKDIWDKYLCCINEKHRITRNITIIDEDEFFNLKYFIKTIRRIK
ncbi:MAG: hypothetical protein IJ736_01895 [Firmicutes bacterium]|nr:hypothetical protein [Bacillota bacterium]